MKMLPAIYMFVKNRDAFGHQVNLTVKNVNGSETASKFGGIVTIFIYLFICVYGVIKSIKMSEENLDNFSSNEEIVDFDMVKNINLTGMTPLINF